VGGDWEHVLARSSQLLREPAALVLWSPRQVELLNPSIPLPASYDTVENILQLPLQSFETAVGPGAPPQRDFKPNRVLDLVRLHAGDSWHIGSRLTIDAALSGSSNQCPQHRLSKPSHLSPILGVPGVVGATNRNSFLMLGFAWTVTAMAGRLRPVLALRPTGQQARRAAGRRRTTPPLGTGRPLAPTFF
jgi:hypothetical protein